METRVLELWKKIEKWEKSRGTYPQFFFGGSSKKGFNTISKILICNCEFGLVKSFGPVKKIWNEENQGEPMPNFFSVGPPKRVLIQFPNFWFVILSVFWTCGKKSKNEKNQGEPMPKFFSAARLGLYLL